MVLMNLAAALLQTAVPEVAKPTPLWLILIMAALMLFAVLGVMGMVAERRRPRGQPGFRKYDDDANA
jgi:hypothetical protein